MGSEALRRGKCEPLIGKEAVSRDGGGVGRNRRQVGSRAQGDYAAHLVSPQGPGGGGSQGPDCWPPQGKRRLEDIGG